jgi:glycosyltransferase involved in cell wall biosynthesis
MRVALLQNFVAPYRVPLYERLRDRLSALKVFVSTPMESDRTWAVDWGTIDVEVQRNFTLHRSFRDPAGFTRTLRVHFPYDTLVRLWRYRPDAVISVELGIRSLQVAIYKMLRPSTRLLIWCKLSEHTEQSWGGVRRALRRFILARADGILVNGESGARYIATFGVSNDRIFRVNQPVDVEMFIRAERQRPDAARSRLLCSGSLSERKGVVPFLKQLDIWARAHPGTHLEIWWLGDGELRRELEAFNSAPNLAQRFIGAVPYAQLPAWYGQTDILVLPSLSDEWALVVNEAMAAGLPVLGSIYAQAVTELVTDGVTGWIFDPKSDRSVQNALDRVQTISPNRFAAMRNAARSRIATLTPDAAAARIFDALCAIGEREPTPLDRVTGQITPAPIGSETL